MKTTLIRGTVASVATAVLVVSTAHVASATESSPLNADRTAYSTTTASNAEMAQLADELEKIFSVYIQQDQDAIWAVTAEGRSSGLPLSDLTMIAKGLNYRASAQGSTGNQVQPYAADYTRCVIDTSGLGGLVGLFTGAFTKLIEKELWAEAAKYIIKVVGKNAIKGGVVGLAATLAASAIWCATPWSK